MTTRSVSSGRTAEPNAAITGICSKPTTCSALGATPPRSNASTISVLRREIERLETEVGRLLVTVKGTIGRPMTERNTEFSRLGVPPLAIVSRSSAYHCYRITGKVVSGAEAPRFIPNEWWRARGAREATIAPVSKQEMADT